MMRYVSVRAHFGFDGRECEDVVTQAQTQLWRDYRAADLTAAIDARHQFDAREPEP